MNGKPGNWRRAVALGALLLAAAAAQRIYLVEAGPPAVIVSTYKGDESYRDEVAKAHEARNRALFGAWKLNPADGYGFWRQQSPVWVYGLWQWFEAFGVTFVAARAYVIVYALAWFAVLYGMLASHYGVAAALLGTGLVTFNFGLFFYTRMALMEPVVLFYVTAAGACLASAWRRPDRGAGLVALGAIGYTAACLTKQSALLFLPVFGGAWAALARAHWRAPLAAGGRPPGRRVLGWAALASLALITGVLVYLLLDEAYGSRLAFNAQHFAKAQRRPLGEALAHGLYWSFTGQKFLGIFVFLAPVGMAFAVAEIARMVLVTRGRSEAHKANGEPPLLAWDAPPDALAWGAAAALLLALGANLVTAQHVVRFQMVLVPGMAVLAGLFGARLWHNSGWPAGWKWWPRPRAVLATALVIFGVYHGARYVMWARGAEASFQVCGARLRELLGEREAVIVGEYAAQCVFETRYKHYYLRPGQFNDTREQLEALGITHLLAGKKDFVRRQIFKRKAPEMLDGMKTVGSASFFGRSLELYELRPPPQR